MTVIARFEVIPVREGSMSTAIAQALQALDRYPVSYETTATDTIIEAETVDQVFEAVQAAHQAIPEDRVITSIEIDEDRRRPQSMHERVASVEQQLGHPPQRTQELAQQQVRPAQQSGAAGSTPAPAQQGQTATQPQPTGGQPQPTGGQPQPTSGGFQSQPGGGQFQSQPPGGRSATGTAGQPMGGTASQPTTGTAGEPPDASQSPQPSRSPRPPAPGQPR